MLQDPLKYFAVDLTKCVKEMEKKDSNISVIKTLLDKLFSELKDIREIISMCINYYTVENKMRFICLDNLKNVIPLHMLKIVILKASTIFGSTLTLNKQLKDDMYKIGLVAVDVNTCFNRNLV